MNCSCVLLLMTLSAAFCNYISEKETLDDLYNKWIKLVYHAKQYAAGGTVKVKNYVSSNDLGTPDDLLIHTVYYRSYGQPMCCDETERIKALKSIDIFKSIPSSVYDSDDTHLSFKNCVKLMLSYVSKIAEELQNPPPTFVNDIRRGEKEVQQGVVEFNHDHGAKVQDLQDLHNDWALMVFKMKSALDPAVTKEDCEGDASTAALSACKIERNTVIPKITVNDPFHYVLQLFGNSTEALWNGFYDILAEPDLLRRQHFIHSIRANESGINEAFAEFKYNN